MKLDLLIGRLFLNRQFQIIIPSVLVLILVTVTAGIISKQTSRVEEVERVIPVTVSSPFRGEIHEELQYTGNIEARQMVTITPRSAGTLLTVNVRVGDRVSKGSKIAQIDPDASNLTWKQALGAYNAAKAQLNKAESGASSEEIDMALQNVNQSRSMYDSALDQFSRIEKLYEEQIVTMSDYEKSKTQVDIYKAQLQAATSQYETVKAGARKEDLAMARANLEAAKAQLDLAQLSLNYTTITSPIRGIVAMVHVEPGQVVSQTIPVCTVTDIERVKIKVKIPEKYYSYINRQKSEMTFHAVPVSYPDRKFKATIMTVSPFISPENRTFAVELDINNSEQLLTAGMFCEVIAVVNQRDNALLIPVEAIDSEGNIWVMNSSQSASSRKLVPGINNGKHIEVLSGVTEQDLVIIDGNDYINESSILKVIDESSDPVSAL
jgi:multidrug efflux pump subunit AcrA (membrane-fusion protein)